MLALFLRCIKVSVTSRWRGIGNHSYGSLRTEIRNSGSQLRKLHLCFLLPPKYVQGYGKTNRRSGVAMGYCERAGLLLASLHGEAQDRFHFVLSSLPELILELAGGKSVCKVFVSLLQCHELFSLAEYKGPFWSLAACAAGSSGSFQFGKHRFLPPHEAS